MHVIHIFCYFVILSDGTYKTGCVIIFSGALYSHICTLKRETKESITAILCCFVIFIFTKKSKKKHPAFLCLILNNALCLY